MKEYVDKLSKDILRPEAKEFLGRKHTLWKKVLSETNGCIKAGTGNENVRLYLIANTTIYRNASDMPSHTFGI